MASGRWGSGRLPPPLLLKAHRQRGSKATGPIQPAPGVGLLMPTWALLLFGLLPGVVLGATSEAAAVTRPQPGVNITWAEFTDARCTVPLGTPSPALQPLGECDIVPQNDPVRAGRLLLLPCPAFPSTCLLDASHHD
jgi:hypothetical protein